MSKTSQELNMLIYYWEWFTNLSPLVMNVVKLSGWTQWLILLNAFDFRVSPVPISTPLDYYTHNNENVCTDKCYVVNNLAQLR